MTPQYAEMLSLPDQLMDLLDEWGEAREEEADDGQQKNCHQRFPHFILAKFDVNRAMTFMNILITGIQTARAPPLLLSYITIPQCRNKQTVQGPSIQCVANVEKST